MSRTAHPRKPKSESIAPRTRLEEIARDLEAIGKLKDGPWEARIRSGFQHWHDDPSHNCTEILARGGNTQYTIAGGTIYDTQRECAFMAAARMAYPEALELERAALIQLQGALKRLERSKKRSKR